MKKFLTICLTIITVTLLTLSLVACGNKKPSSGSDGDDNYIPTKSVAEIKNNLGNNFEMVVKISGADLSESSETTEYTATIKEDKEYIFYSSYEGNNTSTLVNYLLKDDKLYVYSPQTNKYVNMPNLEGYQTYFTAYELMIEYSTLENYEYTSVSDVRYLNKDCKQYVYSGKDGVSSVNFKLTLDKELGICLKFESESSVGNQRISSTFEVISFKKGEANLDSEIAKIDNGGSEQGGEQGGDENKIFNGKTKAQIESALGENFVLNIANQDEYHTGTSIVTKDKGYITFNFVNSGGYDDTILIKDDYYLSRRNNESNYFYVNHYDDNGNKSTDVDDMQHAYNTLVNNSYNLKYDTIEQTTFLGKACTKLVYQAPRPYSYSPISIKEYVIDNETGLCLKYSSTVGSSEDELETEVIEVKSLTKGAANLDGEISKIICVKWLSNEQFTQVGLTNVTAPIGTFKNTQISLSDTNANVVYDIDYLLDSMEKAIGLCQAFYDAGAKYNSEETEVPISQLYLENTEESIEFTCYSTKGYITVVCEYNQFFKNYELNVYIAVTGESIHEHSWGKVVYQWSTDYKTCTATRVCLKDSSHIETETVTAQVIPIRSQACEQSELTSFLAVFTNTSFAPQTQSNVETKPALEHNYNQEKAESKFIKDSATCESSAVYYKSCKCGAKGTETFVYGNPLGHDEENGTLTWEWTETADGYTAKAIFTCGRDSSHTEKINATLTQQKTLATCVETGKIVYTATVERNGNTFTENKTVELQIDFNAHLFSESFTTDVEPTCTEAGSKSKHCLRDGCDGKDQVTPINALQHDFSGEYESHDATHHSTTCLRDDCNEQKIVECTFSTEYAHDSTSHYHECSVCQNTSEIENHSLQEIVNAKYLKREATCSNKAVYYKSCKCGYFLEDDDNTFEYGEKSAHKFVFVEFEWTETAGNYTAKAKYVCSENPEHEKFEDALVTNEITKYATCVETGTRIYTATYDGKTATAEETIEVDANNHVETTFYYSDNYDGTHTAYHTCCNNAYQTVAHVPNDDDGDCTTDITCKICDGVATQGQERHNYGNWAYENKENHKHSCQNENCNAIESEEHYGGEATCLTGAICEVCKQEYQEALGHDFEYASHTDDEYHYCNRDNCDYKEQHQFGEDNTCDVCLFEANYTLGLEYAELQDGTLSVAKGNATDTEVIIPAEYMGKAVTQIATNGFSGHPLTSVVIPSSINSLNDGAFGACQSLENVTFEGESNLTQINGGVFLNCASIKYISLPNGVTTLGAGAFNGCSALKNIDLPNTITTFGADCFKNCTSLISLDIPELVTKIPTAFASSCANLSTIDFTNSSVSTIGNYAFSNCGIVELNLPESLKTIGESAFANCKSMTSLNIPEGVVDIISGAFEKCSALTSVVIPNSVTNMVYHTFFDGCTSLISVTIGSGITDIKPSTFSNCTSLEEIVIPSNVTRISGGSFRNSTNLKTVIVPTSVNYFGNDAFAGASNLLKLYYLGDREQFNNANFESSYKTTLDAITYFYSEETPTTSGKFWRFVDGVPTIYSDCEISGHTKSNNFIDHDGSGHTYLCSVCGEEITEEHTFNVEDYTYIVSHRTCTEGEKYYLLCACGEHGEDTFEKYPALGHDLGAWEETQPTCTENGSRVRTCKRNCGYSEEETIKALGHNFDTENWMHDEYSHWHKCLRCEEIDGEEQHVPSQEGEIQTQPTCSSVGEKLCHCTCCGEEIIAQIPTVEHSYLNWDYNDQKHWRICSECGDKENVEESHSLQEIVDETYLKSDATCLNKAVYYKSCVCGYYVEDEDNTFEYGEALGHDFDCENVEWNWVETLDGYSAFAIFTCNNDSEHKDTIEANIVIESQTQSTCSSQGEIVYKATVTKGGYTHTNTYSVQLELDKNNHTPDESCWYYDDLTNHYRKCYDCEAIITESVTAHDWNEGEITTEPSCTEKGKKTYACESCGANKFEEVDLIAHSYDQEQWSYDLNNHWHICSRCDEIDESSVASHQYDAETDYCVCGQFNPNHCEHSYIDGYNQTHHYEICEYCKNVINSVAHNFQSIVDNEYLSSEATCLEPTKYFKTCSCGAVSQETFDDGEPLGHDYINSSYDDDYHYCNRCEQKEAHVPSTTATKCDKCKNILSFSLGLSFTKIDGKEEYSVSIGSCKDLIITLPATYNGLPVTEVATNGFASSKAIGITIPSGIKKISNNAFSLCESLKDVSLPDTLETIGQYAFSYCTKLQQLSLPNSLISIEYGAFSNCNYLTNVNLPDSLEIIESAVFKNCVNLTTVVFPNSITVLNASVFDGCSKLKKVDLGTGMETIKSYAFSGVSALETLVLHSDNLKKIETVAIQSTPASFKIFYTGTEEQWNQVEVIYQGTGVNPRDKAYLFTKTAPTEEGKYWFYLDGNPTIWTVTEPDGHVWGEWEHDGEYHWRYCLTPNCMGEEKAEHNYDGATCVDCGVVNPEACTHNWEHLYNEDTHYEKCSICMTVRNEEAHTLKDVQQASCLKSNATCEATAVYYKSCDCGYISEETFEYGEPLGHNHVFIENLSSPTCTAEGEELWRCTKCNDEITKPIDMIAHDYSETDYNSLQHWNICSVCGDIEEDSKVNHSYNTWGGDDDNHWHICQCGKTDEESVEQHDWGTGAVTTPATCAEAGVMTYTCSICEKTKTEEIETLPHSINSSLTQITKEATWTEEGTKVKHCGNCDHTEEEAIPVLTASKYLVYELIDGVYFVSGYTGDNTTVYIANSYNDLPVVGIKNKAFLNKSNLTKVNMQGYDDNDVIGESAFEGCYSLRSVVSGTGKKLSNNAFLGCGNLNLLDFDISQIGENTFRDCNNLTSVSLTSEVTEIPAYAFYNCYQLVNVYKSTLKTNLTIIGEHAFENCSNLSTIYLDVWVKIDEDAFFNATIEQTKYNGLLQAFLSSEKFANLGSVPTNIVLINNTPLVGDLTMNFVLYSIPKYAFANQPITSVTLPNDVSSIGEGAFYKTNITSITLPNNVTEIKNKAFMYCSNLQSITYGAVKKIGDNAFNGCSNLTSFNFGNVLEKIGNEAFNSSGLTGVITIPTNVNYIGNQCFSNCLNLTGIEFENVTGWKSANSLEVNCQEITLSSNARDNLKKLTTGEYGWISIFYGDFFNASSLVNLTNITLVNYSYSSSSYLQISNKYYHIKLNESEVTDKTQLKFTFKTSSGNIVTPTSFTVYRPWGNVLIDDLNYLFTFDGESYVARNVGYDYNFSNIVGHDLYILVNCSGYVKIEVQCL